MNDRELIRRVRRLGAGLKRAAKWQGASVEVVDADKDHFVYELLCFLTVALAATKTYTAIMTLRHNSKLRMSVPLFPRSPGLKKNFSLLILSQPDKTVAFELCPGIYITDKCGKPRALDINLLIGNSSEAPHYKELCAVWDAKYVSDAAKRLSDVAVGDFVINFEELGKPLPPQSWITSIADAAFQKSGVLTNGQRSTELDAMLQSRGVCETSNFPKKPATRP
jgi:hypothetical protein